MMKAEEHSMPRSGGKAPEHRTHKTTAGRHGRAEPDSRPSPRDALDVIVHDADGGTRRTTLSPWRVYTFGRSRSADLHIDDERTSRVHGTLFFHDGWVVSDARSSNGTFVADAARFEQGRDRAETTEAQRVTEREPIPVGSAILPGTRHWWIEVVAAGEKVHPEVADADDQHLSPAARSFDAALAAAARHRRTVLLLGPTGAGKTHAAEAIHARSGAKGRFVAVNCAGLPADPTQLRSVLFGHRRGAFTGAADALVGFVYAAEGGTLFLDEVESLNPAAQGFLLDVIERRGPLRPLGADPGEELPPPDVRVIAASKARLAESGLRRDLQFRLADGDLVPVPSLAERREDIPGLARAFLQAEAEATRQRARFAAGAVEALQEADWPGELRQLRGAIAACFRAAADEESAGVAVIIDERRVRERLARQRAIHGDESAPAVDANPTRLNLKVRPSLASAEGAPVAHNPRRLSAEQVRAALDATGGNIEHAAHRLGIARRTLMGKMDAFGIERPRRRG